MFLNEKEKGNKKKTEREIVVCGSSFFSAFTWWGTFPVPVLARCCFLQLLGKWQYRTKFLLQLNQFSQLGNGSGLPAYDRRFPSH